MTYQNVGVVGCGLMGSGIAEVCARAGYYVRVREVNEELLARGLERIQTSLQRALSRKKISENERTTALNRIQGTTQIEDLSACDLIIEAVVENLETKQEVFRTLDRVCSPQTVLASNTSCLSITTLAGATQRPERVLGLHFFNPAPVMPLVELVRTILVDAGVVSNARAFAESLGKTVVISKDYPGFIVNALLVPYLLDAVRALEMGLASREDIDTAVKLGLNHPMGPLTLLDFVGLDTTLLVADAMFAELKDTRYAAPPLLRQMVAAGRTGRKAGQGFYSYE